jgi:hypothetical protein
MVGQNVMLDGRAFNSTFWPLAGAGERARIPLFARPSGGMVCSSGRWLLSGLLNLSDLV